MTENSLIAEPGTPSRFSGTFLLDDLDKLSGDLASGSWVSAGLLGVTTVIDLAATVADPIGSLIAAGLGYLLDHLPPLTTWLEDLTGSPGQVEGFAGTWENVAERLHEEAETLVRRVESDLARMGGDAIAAYRNHARDLAEHIAGLGRASGATADALKVAASIVDFVHSLVRDVLAQVVGAIISWAAEELLSFGLLTPLVASQAALRVSEGVTRVTGSIRELISSFRALKTLVEKLDQGVGAVRELLDHVHPDAARAEHVQGWLDPRSPHDPAAASPRDPAHLPRHRADPKIKPILKREKEVGRVELPRDIVGEAAAAPAGGLAAEEGGG